MQDKLSPVRAARRARLLDAAEALFVAQGFRATSIEGIAEAAGMSKVTLYGYFRDKETVFAAVAERIADTMEAAVQTALAAEASFPAPLAMALTAKHRIVLERVQRSAFASELFQAKAAHVARRFAALDDAIIAGLMEALEREGLSPAAAGETARLLFAAANGIANRAHDAATLAAQLDRLVRAVVTYDPGR
ncbi:MAG: TetR/AcrR family transcriptional regulator [Novosphingobium sp.]|nr:TetR/AcrR family transcriptional regulator [Novosphingobium sp.]